MSVNRNRMANVHNRYQGDMKRVLCVCSAGLLRSPTIAWVLSNDPYNFNTRAAGVSQEYALIPVDEALVEWADEIVCADIDHVGTVSALLQSKHITDSGKPVHVLELPDEYMTREPELVEIVKKKVAAIYGKKEK